MIAYNSSWLDALQTQDTARAWHQQQLLTAEQWKAAQEQNPVPFYTPNIFVRIGLAIFCTILLSAAIGLLGVFMDMRSESSWAVLCLFFGIISLVVLEQWAIRSSRHYRSGVDDMLLYFATMLILFSIMSQLPYNTGSLVYYIIAWPFLVAGSIRYLDRLMTAAVFCCSLMIMLLIVKEIPRLALYLLPFSGMVFSAVVYYFVRQGQQRHDWRHWHGQLAVLELLALTTLYLSGNYWVVQQAGAELFQLEQVPIPWFFWAFTFILPLAYIFQGWYKKERMMLDVGLGCIAAAVYTFRYYFHVLPLEWAAVIGGAVLFGSSYLYIRYLRQHEGAYTYLADGDPSLLQEIEEQLIEQTISSQNPPTAGGDTDTFGGGQFGGGGAGADF